jgi:hypothetical protein
MCGSKSRTKNRRRDICKMGWPDYHERPPNVRVGEFVANRPNQLYIGGLVQRLEREQREWSALWRKSELASQKFLGHFWFWAIDAEIKKLNALWNEGKQEISKSDFAKMRAASETYINACLREEVARLEARQGAVDVGLKNKQLAVLHLERELARSRLGK